MITRSQQLLPALFAAAVSMLGWTSAAHGQPRPVEVADELSIEELQALQQEVAALATENAALRERVRTGAAQSESWLRQLELQEQSLLGQRDALTGQLAAVPEEGSAQATPSSWMQLFEQTVAMTRSWIDRSLHYRLAERSERLNQIVDSVRAGVVSPLGGIARVWNLLHDEHQLCTDYGLDRQALLVAGQPMLVDVARLGMVALYIRLPDGRAGYLRPGDGDNVTLLNDRRATDAVLDLFQVLASSGIPDIRLVPVWSYPGVEAP
jgi:hypothetical protein